MNISEEDVLYWNSKGFLPSLTIDQIRDVARVFVNGKLAGIYLHLQSYELFFFLERAGELRPIIY